jgi:hypothetical protein
MQKRTFGPVSIPRVHEHLAIDEAERDAWPLCMAHAVEEQPWEPYVDAAQRALTMDSSDFGGVRSRPRCTDALWLSHLGP